LVLNISNNNIGEHTFVDGWRPYSGKGFKYFRDIDGKYDFANEWPEGCGPVGVAALVNAIKDMRAMTKLDMSRNKFKGAAAGKSIGDMLTGNSTLKDLNLSKCNIDSDAAQGISTGLAGNGALLHFDISHSDIRSEGGKALVEALKCNQVINTLSIAENNLSFNSSGDHDMSALVALADAIPGMRALTSLNLSKNKLGLGAYKAEGAKFGLYSSKKDNPGNYETDMTGIIAVADVIKNMGALTTLDISSNMLTGNPYARGFKPDLTGACMPFDEIMFSLLSLFVGIVALADAIPNMRALSKLDVRENNINANGKSALKKAAGVGVFRSRYAQLKFLAFNSTFNDTCSFPVAHAGSSFYSSAPLALPLCTRMYSLQAISRLQKRRTSNHIAVKGGPSTSIKLFFSSSCEKRPKKAIKKKKNRRKKMTDDRGKVFVSSTFL
jgi:hypothetical protein